MVNDLIRHIEIVRESSIIIGNILIEQGRQVLGHDVIRRGHAHDLSKFTGIERLFLHQKKKVNKKNLELAIQQHVTTNDHHPEFFENGMDDMNEAQLIEWCCDVYARSAQFGTDLMEWVDNVAVKRFNIKNEQYELIVKYLKCLTSGKFIQKRE